MSKRNCGEHVLALWLTARQAPLNHFAMDVVEQENAERQRRWYVSPRR